MPAWNVDNARPRLTRCLFGIPAQTEGTNMREKIVLFWHNHFVSDRTKVNYPQHTYQQNALFRPYAFGDFRQFTKAVTINPAMLIHPDGLWNAPPAWPTFCTRLSCSLSYSSCCSGP